MKLTHTPARGKPSEGHIRIREWQDGVYCPACEGTKGSYDIYDRLMRATVTKNYEPPPRPVELEVDEFGRPSYTFDDPSQERAQKQIHKAEKLVFGDRQATYGHPFDDYTRTAALWSALIGHEITAHQAALMMVLVKLSREMNKQTDDNMVDAHGYLMCATRILDRMNE